jgi:hypothetical protein
MSLKTVLSNEIITYPQYVNKTLNTLASDNSGHIAYEMNKYGYRTSKDAEIASQYNVLALGCSWTMGIGVDNDLIWPTLMGNKLGKVYNYGMYGASVSFVAKTLFKFVSSELIPDIVLIMWPGFSRRDYITEAGEFRKIGGFRAATNEDPVWRNNEEDLLFLQLRNDNQDLMEFWEAYNFVETVSKLYNIKVFHTVAGYYYEIYKNLKPKLENTINYRRFYEPRDCYQNDHKAADKQHPGKAWHENFANGFYSFIKDKIDV